MIKIGNNISEFSTYSCQPKTKEELKEIIRDRILIEGNECDLNDIDTSLITDMSGLFAYFDFNGDISKWNVSNVKNMSRMFIHSTFNRDISNWNVHNVENMAGMFYGTCFDSCISRWDIRNVTDMRTMFYDAYFNKDISNWKINKRCDTIHTFARCPIKEEFKPKALQS